MSLKLGIQDQVIKYYQAGSNDDDRLTIDLFMQMKLALRLPWGRGVLVNSGMSRWNRCILLLRDNMIRCLFQGLITCIATFSSAHYINSLLISLMKTTDLLPTQLYSYRIRIRIVYW